MNREAWQFYRRFYRGAKATLSFSVGISIVQSLLVFPITLLVRYIFDTVIPGGRFSLLALAGGSIVLLYLAEGGATLWTRYIILKTTKSIVQRLREELLHKCYLLPRSFYSQQDRGTLHTILVQDTERVDIMTNAVLAIFLPSLFVCLVLTAVMAYLNWYLSLIMILTFAVLLWLNTWMGRDSKQKVQIFHRSFERFSRGMMFVLQMMDLTRVQCAEDLEAAEQKKHFEDLRRTSGAMAWLRSAFVLAQTSTVAVGAVVILIVGGYAVVTARMTLGELLSFYAAVALLKPRLQVLAASVPQIIEGNESLQTLYQFMKTDQPRPYHGTRRIPFSGHIRLDRVTFGYTEVPVVRDICLAVEPGTTIALYGPNGSGKTTIANLILGLYRPQSGRLWADDQPYDEIDILDLRRYIGVVMQHPFLFPGTILKNMTYGLPGTDRQQILGAAALATADEFISRLPAGYETRVGENGATLSGGEGQRIALARALLREPKVLILDEPTIHLDVESVRRLLQGLRTLPYRPAIVMISHDQKVVGEADRVHILKEGHLISGGAPGLSPQVYADQKT